MLLLNRARSAFRWWGMDGDATPPPPRTTHLRSVSSNARPETADGNSQIGSFLEEISAEAPDWLDRLRLINLQNIRDQVGPTWSRLQQKVELLADKIIREEASSKDRFEKIGDAEFLVFFAEASPEEIKLRSMAVVEAIHDKLFGIADPGMPAKLAECHAPNIEDLALASEDAAQGSPCRNPVSAHMLRRRFSSVPEFLDGADVTQSAHAVIDSILAAAIQSEEIAEFAPHMERLGFLSRNMKTLTSAVIAAGDPNGPAPNQEKLSIAVSLRNALGDSAALASLLHGVAGRPHGDILAALKKLRQERAERAAGDASSGADSPAPAGVPQTEMPQFLYTPVYRSISRGENLYKGLSRIETQTGQINLVQNSHRDAREHQRQETATIDRWALQHGIQFHSGRVRRSILMVPVHAETLCAPSLMREFSKIVRAADASQKKRLVIEILGYSDTGNAIALRRAIDELRTHFQVVFVTLSPDRIAGLHQAAEETKKLGIHALGVDLSTLTHSRHGIFRVIAQLSLAGEQLSLRTYVSNVPSAAAFTAAVQSKVTYISAPIICPARLAPEVVGRTNFATILQSLSNRARGQSRSA